MAEKEFCSPDHAVSSHYSSEFIAISCFQLFSTCTKCVLIGVSSVACKDNVVGTQQTLACTGFATGALTLFRSDTIPKAFKRHFLRNACSYFIPTPFGRYFTDTSFETPTTLPLLLHPEGILPAFPSECPDASSVVVP